MLKKKKNENAGRFEVGLAVHPDVLPKLWTDNRPILEHVSSNMRETPMQHTVGIAKSRSQHVATFVAAIAAALCLLPACMSIGTPRAGERVAIQPGEALVFGRIRMLDAKNEHIEYSPFWFDPWDQPFFVPGPRMTLELRQLYPPGGVFKYKANPAPAIEKNGSFFWILSAGNYVLLGNPRLYGSERFNREETVTLASFRVPASGGTIYLGTLIISIVYDLQD
ncbi:MAG TPA: hypothetical protein VF905_02885, partial [Nitrospirota bacterium]